MTDEGKIRNIDSVLRMFETKTEVSENEIASIHGNETQALLQTMLTLGVIFPLRTDERDKSYILGPAAYEIKTFGTYGDYVAYKKEEKRLAQQLIKSTLTTNTLQKLLLALTSIFSLASLLLAIVDNKYHREELDVAREELRLHKSQLDRCEGAYAENSPNQKMDSLQQSPDSLKKRD